MVSFDLSLGVETKVRDVVSLALHGEEDVVLMTGHIVTREMGEIVDMADALRMMACP